MKRKSQKSCSALLLLVLLLFGVSNAFAATTEIISVTNEGAPGSTDDRHSWSRSGISHDGRYVVFTSNAKLTADDVDPSYRYPQDVYLRDRLAGTTTLLSPTNFNGIMSRPFGEPAISGDGNYIAIRTAANPGVITGRGISDLLLINRATGAIEIVTEGTTGYSFAIDFDGDVFFIDDFSTSYTGMDHHIYKYDRRTKQNTLIYTTGTAIWTRFDFSVDDSGSLLCFSETYSNQSSRVASYLLDLTTGNKTLLNRTSNGEPPWGDRGDAWLSNSGDFAIFLSRATDIGSIPYPTASWNLFMYDVKNDTVERISFNDPQYGEFYPTEHVYNLGHIDVSDDGRFIAVVLSGPEYFGYQYGAVLDRQVGRIEFLPDGTPENNMLHPVMTPDGRYVLSTGITSIANGVFTLLYDRSGTNQAFTIDAGPDQTIEQETPNGAYATLAGVLSGDSCIGDQTYQWSWSGGETIGTNPTIHLLPGTTTVTLDWSGCGGTASDTVDVSVEDNTPPSLAVTDITGTLGEAGWYRSNVSVQLVANDNGSGVAAIHYSLDGVKTIVVGTSASVAVNGDGGHALSYWAVDNADNSGSPTVTTIQIDSIAPSITGNPLTQPNANGWYNSNIDVHFSATDSMSGIASVTPDATVSLEGAGQSVAGTAFDVAGNRDDYNVNGINLDRTPPLIITTGVVNGATYNLGLVPQATSTASDSLSGVAEKTEAITGTPDIFGCGTFTYTVTATDQAGNAVSSFVIYEVKATPEGTSALIEELVNTGTLPAQTAGTLQATLEKVLSGYSSNPNLGDNMVNTFLNQINAALNSNKISPETAALLNNAANYIMQNN